MTERAHSGKYCYGKTPLHCIESATLSTGPPPDGRHGLRDRPSLGAGAAPCCRPSDMPISTPLTSAA